MKTKGDKVALDFEVEAVEGGALRKVAFADLLGELNLVSIYMKNNTPSCDAQNRSLCDVIDRAAEAGVRVFAVSPDGAKSHLNYATKHGLKHVLVSDKDHRFARAVDAMVEKKMYGKTYTGPARAAFLIDRDGVIVDLIEKVEPKTHADQVARVVASARG